MVKIIEPPAFALTISVQEKTIKDLANFTNYAITPRSFELYVGKDHHIYSESLIETGLPDQMAQLFKRTFDEANFNTREKENKRIIQLARNAFIEILGEAAHDPDAAKYLAELQNQLEFAPESQTKTSLLEWIQEIRQQWKLNPKTPSLVYRKLHGNPKLPDHPEIAQVARDGFTKLKKEHTAHQALAIAATPFLTFPGNLEMMIQKSNDLQAAAREVANFYQAVKQLDQLAPAISQENKSLIQNCLKIYALNAEKVVRRYRGGEVALKAVFGERKRPSEEISPPQSAPLRR